MLTELQFVKHEDEGQEKAWIQVVGQSSPIPLVVNPAFKNTLIDGQKTWIWNFTVSKFEALHKDFEAEAGDVILASVMKTGTTWMKAILHSLITCVHSLPNMLDKYNPHRIVPGIEFPMPWPHIPSPRLLATHLPLYALPNKIIADDEDGSRSLVKIIYVTRNPRDSFVSLWKYMDKVGEVTTKHGIPKDVPKEDAFDSFCKGRFHGGPFPENVLGYVRESWRRPTEVMVVRYEDLQKDCEGVICEVGNFLGYSTHVVRNNASIIAQRCSFETLRSLDVNKETESVDGDLPPNASYFRKGKSGDWKDHFTPAMEDLINKEIESKLEQEGFEFSY